MHTDYKDSSNSQEKLMEYTKNIFQNVFLGIQKTFTAIPTTCNISAK